MSRPPSGTVTFIFTDIEGSTKLWEQFPEAMKPALARHDTLARAAVEKNRGYVVKMRGDGIHAAFASADDALAAALAMQRGMVTEKWGEIGRLRVRVALHTGAVQERDGDYFGSPVNRAARLLSCGHGGQILLSLATQELVQSHLPPGATLLDLGVHRLKDLVEPERIFQLVVPDLPAAFPRLITLDNQPTNLPSKLTPLIGREKQIAAAQRLLRQKEIRLVTFTGAAGIGKTRLALQVAAELTDDFEHGVYFVRLDAPTHTHAMLYDIAHALGVRETGSRSIADTLKERLSGKRVLLALDDLPPPGAPVVNDLLAALPALKVLATWEERLGAAGECEFPVPPLEPPDPLRLVRAGTEVAAVVQRSAAGELFAQRAAAVNRHFAVTNDNALAVAEICSRLFGLPLAIELAAAQCRPHTPPEILQELRQRAPMPSGESASLNAQRQTIRAVVDWSYATLTEGEGELLRCLSVFADGFTLEAAERVCGGEERSAHARPDSGTIIASRRLAFTAATNIADALPLFVSKNLLHAEDIGGARRYGMPAAIRARLADLHAELDNAADTRRNLANYALGLVEQAEPKLRGVEQDAWLNRLDHERGILSAALRWAQQSDDVEIGLRLTAVLWRYWHTRGLLSEGRAWLEEFLALAKKRGLSGLVPVRAKMLNGLGALAHAQGEYAQAKKFYEQALALRRKLEDKSGVAALLNNLGLLAQKQRAYPRAQVLSGIVRPAPAIGRSLGDRAIAEPSRFGGGTAR